MSAFVEILSGLGDKGPAAIVVEALGKRLLLDAGVIIPRDAGFADRPRRPDEPWVIERYEVPAA